MRPASGDATPPIPGLHRLPGAEPQRDTELGPGDLGLALGYVAVPRDPYPPEMREARERVFAACRARGVPFLEGATPETIAEKLDEGVRVIAGQQEATARVGRAHSRRAMPV